MDIAKQKRRYSVMQDSIESGDYDLYSYLYKIAYYIPQNESHYIMAVDHIHKVAISTGFYEMADIEAPHGEYALIYDKVKGLVMPMEYNGPPLRWRMR